MEDVKVGEIYRHFKGTYHQILNIAYDSETLEKMVVYNHKDTSEVWVRPEKNFFDEISNRSDNITKQRYRFEKVN